MSVFIKTVSFQIVNLSTMKTVKQDDVAVIREADLGSIVRKCLSEEVS